MSVQPSRYWKKNRKQIASARRMERRRGQRDPHVAAISRAMRKVRDTICQYAHIVLYEHEGLPPLRNQIRRYTSHQFADTAGALREAENVHAHAQLVLDEWVLSKKNWPAKSKAVKQQRRARYSVEALGAEVDKLRSHLHKTEALRRMGNDRVQAGSVWSESWKF